MRAVSLTEEPNPKPPMDAVDKYPTQKHTHTHTHTHTQTRTHNQRRGSVCSAQSSCLQVDESVRTESSVVVSYCYWPEASSSSINDAQQAVGQIPSLSSPVCTVSLSPRCFTRVFPHYTFTPEVNIILFTPLHLSGSFSYFSDYLPAQLKPQHISRCVEVKCV